VRNSQRKKGVISSDIYSQSMLESYMKFSPRKMGKLMSKFLLNCGAQLREIYFGKRYVEAIFGSRRWGWF